MSYSLWSHEPQKARPPCPSPTPGVFFSKYKTFLLPISCHTLLYFSFPGGSVVKNLPTRAGDLRLIPGLGRSPGEEMATHSSILAWEVPWTGEHDRPVGLQRVRHDWVSQCYYCKFSMYDAPHVAWTWDLPLVHHYHIQVIVITMWLTFHSRHPDNHSVNQDAEHFYYLRSFLHVFLHQYSPPLPI